MKRPLDELAHEAIQAAEAVALASPGRQRAARERMAWARHSDLLTRVDEASAYLDRTFADKETTTTEQWIAVHDKYVAAMKQLMAVENLLRSA